MKKLMAIFMTVILIMLFSGCNTGNNANSTTAPQATLPTTQPISKTENANSSKTEAVTKSQEETFTAVSPADENNGETADNNLTTGISITVGEKTFSAKLYNNQTTSELIKEFPLNINMTELNGNEKYYNFSKDFTTDTISPEHINSGDIMLYGSTYIVLFYDSFSTTNSYTRLGYVENPEELKSAVGNSDVQVTFSIN